MTNNQRVSLVRVATFTKKYFNQYVNHPMFRRRLLNPGRVAMDFQAVSMHSLGEGHQKRFCVRPWILADDICMMHVILHIIYICIYIYIRIYIYKLTYYIYIYNCWFCKCLLFSFAISVCFPWLSRIVPSCQLLSHTVKGWNLTSWGWRVSSPSDKTTTSENSEVQWTSELSGEI